MADKYLNKTVLTYFYNRLKTIFATQTDLDALDSRVDDIVSEGGEPNLIDSISVNGTVQTITNKNVNIIVPTEVSSLTNDSGYQTQSQVQTLIDSGLEGITGIDFEVVNALPATGEKGIIYLLSNSGTSPNVYDEYIYVNNGFEKIGTTDIDLTQYWSKAELVAITTAEIDTIIDGE